MNSNEDIYFRLLNIFPAFLLKNHFEVANQHKNHVIREILKTRKDTEVLDFVIKSLNYTKQHVYLYELTSGRPDLSMPIMGGVEPISSDGKDGISTVKYFLERNSDIIDTSDFKPGVFINYWPVSICYSKKMIMVKITTMEHKIEEYDGVKIIDLKNKLSEADLKAGIVQDLIDSGLTFRPIDLNKGIKFLWENDLVDAKYGRYRRANSTSIEVMNENYTLKKAMPELYKEMMQSPLEKNIFAHEDGYDENNLPSHFTVEPESGIVSFTLYPPALDANDNVLNLILANN